MLGKTLILLSGLAMPAIAGATTISTTLDQLLSPTTATLVEGDKTYSNFTYIPSTVNPVNPSNITVVLTDDAAQNTYQLRFQGGFYARQGQTNDFDIAYDVTSTSADRIGSASLVFNGAVMTGSGAASAVDNISPVNNLNPVAQLQVFNDGVLADRQLSDTVSLTPSQSYHFDKDVELQSNSPGYVTVSTLDQYITDAVPEPTTAGLLAVGSLLLLKRRQNVAR